MLSVVTMNCDAKKVSLRDWGVGAMSAALVLWTAACSPAFVEGETSQESALEDAQDTTTLRLRAETQGSVNVANAYWMARLSALAYQSEHAQRTALTALGAPIDDAHYRFFDQAGMQAFYVATDHAAILAFRGTEGGSLRDLWTDAAALNRVQAWVGRVHRGFEEGTEALWHDGGLGDFLRSRHGYDRKVDGPRPSRLPLFVTGHSLGGALATLATMRSLIDGCLEDQRATLPRSLGCKDRRIVVTSLMTFGAPRVGDPTLAAWLGAELSERGVSAHRFVNESDVVPQVPVIDYRHVALRNDEDAFLRYLDGGGRLVSGRFNENRSSRVSDHGIEKYVTKLAVLSGGR